MPADRKDTPPWAVVVVVKPEETTPSRLPPTGGWGASTFAPPAGDDEEERKKPMVVPVHREDAKPWADDKKLVEDVKRELFPSRRGRPVPSASGVESHAPPRRPEAKTDEPQTRKAEPEVKKKDERPQTAQPERESIVLLPPLTDGEAWRERVCAKNYAAMDADAGAYGLIGADGALEEPGGVRSLVMHVPRRVQHGKGGAHGVLTQVRPGSILRVQRASKRARGESPPPVRELRVRFTTPARYYGPGSNVTTLGIGVDEDDWRDVVAPRQ
jgi:hypothetical protein